MVSIYSYELRRGLSTCVHVRPYVGHPKSETPHVTRSPDFGDDRMCDEEEERWIFFSAKVFF